MGPYQQRVLVHVCERIGEPSRTLTVGELDVYVVERGHYTVLVTCGASAQPMTVPEHIADREQWRHAELCMFVPREWSEDEWFLEALVDCARLPHEQRTWLSVGHTVYDGAPWPNTLLASLLLTPPYALSESFTIEGEPTIHLFQLVPITAAELAYKHQHQSQALVDELMDYDPQVFMAIEPTRRCAFTAASPLSSTIVIPERPQVDGAWLVIPAARANDGAALDRYLAMAARSLGAAELHVCQSIAADGTSLLLVDGVPLVRLARALSLVDNRTAALRLYKTQGVARTYHDDDERIVRGTVTDAVAAVAEHLGTTTKALRGTTPQPTRTVHGASGRATSWDTLVDDALETDAIADLLGANAPLLADRFGSWRRALDRYEQLTEADDKDDRRAARRDAKRTHGEAIQLAQSITSAPWPLVMDALHRVLVRGGVDPAYLDRFREWAIGS